MSTSSTKTSVQPYLFFDGRCDEAIDFYRKNLGAHVEMLMRFKDNPEPNPNCTPADGEKVMHANLKIGDATILVSDGQCKGNPKFEGFALSFTVATEAEAEKAFAALSAGGQVIMPLGKTFFSPSFGMATDKFGVCWMVYMVPKAR